MTSDHPFAALAGRWVGEGAGEYPTIEPFAYREELTVEEVPGRPVAHWRSKTRDAVTGEVRHGESGFLRTVEGGRVELVVAHSFGIVETATGQLEQGVLTLDSATVVGTASAKTVEAVERRYRFDTAGGELTYTIAMAAVGVPLTHHLRASLGRADPG